MNKILLSIGMAILLNVADLQGLNWTASSSAVVPDGQTINRETAVMDLTVKVRVYLSGALISNGNATSSAGHPLMRDDLRASQGSSFIPADDPYSFATATIDITDKFDPVGPGLIPALTTIANYNQVMSVTGDNAIVDWIYIELRSESDSTVVVATRSGLLQRDGDVVDLDGVSDLLFANVELQPYFVAVRHRNHLGVMTKTAKTVTEMQAGLDFTSNFFPSWDYGTTIDGLDYTGLAQSAFLEVGYQSMWPGNCDADDKIKYVNPGDDLNTIFFDVVSYPENVAFATNFDDCYGYFQGDIDMDGRAKYDNPDDDKNYLFLTLVLYSLNQNFESNFDGMLEQLPK